MTACRAHLEVNLVFERADDRFRVIVTDAPVRRPPPRTFELPFAPFELDALVARLDHRRRGVRRVTEPDADTAREIGGRLFDAVFDRGLGACLEASLAAARASGAAGIRLRLQFADCAELTALPWELLYDRHRDAYLALSVETPVTRSLGLDDDPAAASVGHPLRVLVVVANPGGQETLDADREWLAINEALAPLTASGLVAVDRAPAGSLAAVARQLRRAEYHVLHYVGHGGRDHFRGHGVLALEDPERPDGPPRLTTGRDLAVVLRDHRSLRLVVLNACEGARDDAPDNPFAGIAPVLARAGIPAVIAMQFEVSDEAAVAFGGALYESLASGTALDVAVSDARKAVHAAYHTTEWATPVLHLRGTPVGLFDRAPVPASTAPVLPPAATGSDVGDLATRSAVATPQNPSKRRSPWRRRSLSDAGP